MASTLTQTLEYIINRRKKRNLRQLEREANRSNSFKLKPSQTKKTYTVNRRTIFKVIGWRKDKLAFNNACEYVLRKAECLYTESGEQITNYSQLPSIEADWQLSNKDTQRQLVHMSYSFPEYVTIKEQILDTIQECLIEVFPNNKSMFALHTDTKNIHAHILIRCKDSDGKSLRLGRNELQHIHRAFDEIANSHQLKIEPHQLKLETKKQKQQKQELALARNVPNWLKQRNNKRFKQLELREDTKEQLLELGIPAKHINSFVVMYQENNWFANKMLQEQPKLFGIKSADQQEALKSIEPIEILEYRNIKIPKYLSDKKNVPNWVAKEKNKNYPAIEIDQDTRQKLKQIGITKEYYIQSFAHMYLENKRQATYCVNKMPYLFGLEAPPKPEFSGRILDNAIKLKQVAELNKERATKDLKTYEKEPHI